MICLGETEWQDHGSCEILHKKKKDATAFKEEDWTNTGKTA